MTAAAIAVAEPAIAQLNPGQLIDLGKQIIQGIPQHQGTPAARPPVYRTPDRAVPPDPPPAAAEQRQKAREPATSAARQAPDKLVLEIQRRLADLGYDPGPIDGIDGSSTRRALAAWQRDLGLPADGTPTRQALAMLREGNPSPGGRLAAPGGPSFNCSRAASADEKTICNYPELAQLDLELADAYDQALARSPGAARDRIVSEQRAWIESRRSCGAGIDCLRAMMQFRTAMLAATDDAPATRLGGSAAPPEAGTPAGSQVQSRQPSDGGQASSPAGDVVVQGYVVQFAKAPRAAGPPNEVTAQSVGEAAADPAEDPASLGAIPPSEAGRRWIAETPVLTRAASGVAVTPGESGAPTPEQTAGPGRATGPSDLALPSPSAPLGVEIGMRGTKAQALLETAGFETRGGGMYQLTEGEHEVSLTFHTGEFGNGRIEEPVSQIRYDQTTAALAAPAPDLVDSISTLIGVEPDCKISAADVAFCDWNAPPGLPLVKAIGIRVGGSPGHRTLSLDLSAIADLKARIAAPSNGFSVDAGLIDPLMPEGVGIGQPFSTAESSLQATGYETGSGCDFFREAQTRTISIKLSGGSGCAGYAPVARVTFQVRNTRVEGSIKDLVDRISAAAGAAPRCRHEAELDSAECSWENPPDLPLVSQIYLEASRLGLMLYLDAVRDLEARLPAPAPAPREAKTESHWWDAEIAAAQSDGASGGFLATAHLAQAPPDIQLQARAEGRYAYDFCEGRGLYAQLKDCRCVASTLVDLRVGELASGVAALSPTDRSDQQTIVEKAQAAVETTCPNKAGAASYAYRNCGMSSYGSEVLCTCFAETFSAAYMRSPYAHFTSIGQLSAFSLTECHKRGLE